MIFYWIKDLASLGAIAAFIYYFTPLAAALS